MKSRLNLGSFEVYELSSNIKFQQWRIFLYINTGLFLKHNLIWARGSWGNYSSSTDGEQLFSKIGDEVLLPLVLHGKQRADWSRVSTARLLHFSVFPMSSDKSSDHPSSLEVQQHVIYLDIRFLVASPKEDVIRNLGTGRKWWNRNEFVHLGRVSHREVLL